MGTGYLGMDLKDFERTKIEALKEGETMSGEKGYLQWSENTKFILDEISFSGDEEHLQVNGDLVELNGEHIATISIETEITIDLAAEIVQHYIKKLNKLKAVLEATK